MHVGWERTIGSRHNVTWALLQKALVAEVLAKVEFGLVADSTTCISTPKQTWRKVLSDSELSLLDARYLGAVSAAAFVFRRPDSLKRCPIAKRKRQVGPPRRAAQLPCVLVGVDQRRRRRPRERPTL